MKPVNTIPIETFLDRVKIASRTNQKTVSIDIKEATALAETMTTIMSRLIMKINVDPENKKNNDILKINADGGNF